MSRFVSAPKAPPAINGRPPPNDLDAEAVVLSACLLKQDAVDVCLDILTPTHFFSESNGLIFDAIGELSMARQPVDPTTVGTVLRNRDRLHAVGGPAYLAQVVNASPAVYNVETHARSVRDLWRLRALISECQRIGAEGYGSVGDIQGFLDGAESSIRQVAEQEHAGKVGTLGDGLTEMFASIDGGSEQVSRASMTGFRTYDDMTKGWHPGELIIFAGRPGMGKTSAVCAAAVDIAGKTDRNNRCVNEVLIFSLEMRRVEIATRLACAEAAVDLSKVRGGTLTGEERVRLSQAADYLKALPIHIDDTPGLTPVAMRSSARRHAANAAKHGRRLALVATDHASKANVDGVAGKGATHARELGVMSGMFKDTAKELELPWVLLAQLNRKCEERPNKRPFMSDLKDTGNFEQDADNITFAYREEYYLGQAGKHVHDDARGVAEFIISKQRSGPTGTAFVKFEGCYTRFGNLEPHRLEALQRGEDR